MNRGSEDILNYRVSGKGYPVVFLHGFLESSTMWNGLEFENVQMITIDLPGHGKSAMIDVVSIKEVAGSIVKLLQSIEIERYALVGHSMGGYVGLEILKKDVRCTQLLLMNSNCWADDDLKKVERDRVSSIVLKKKVPFIYEAIPNLFFDPEKYDKEVREQIKESILIEAESISKCSQLMKNRNDNFDTMMNDNDRITVIQGDNDPIVSKTRMENMCLESGVEYIEVKAGHMAHIEARNEVVEIVNSRIKKNGN